MKKAIHPEMTAPSQVLSLEELEQVAGGHKYGQANQRQAKPPRRGKGPGGHSN